MHHIICGVHIISVSKYFVGQTYALLGTKLQNHYLKPAKCRPETGQKPAGGVFFMIIIIGYCSMQEFLHLVLVVSGCGLYLYISLSMWDFPNKAL